MSFRLGPNVGQSKNKTGFFPTLTHDQTNIHFVIMSLFLKFKSFSLIKWCFQKTIIFFLNNMSQIRDQPGISRDPRRISKGNFNFHKHESKLFSRFEDKVSMTLKPRIYSFKIFTEYKEVVGHSFKKINVWHKLSSEVFYKG